MKSVNLDTFESDIKVFQHGFISEQQFHRFKSCLFQLLVAREEANTILQNAESIYQMVTKADKQVELLVEAIANGRYFVFQKRQAWQGYMEQYEMVNKTRICRMLKLRQKLVESIAKAKEALDQRQKRLSHIREVELQKKLAINQMKVIVGSFEGENEKSRIVKTRENTLQIQLSFITIEERIASSNELMERYISVRKALEEKKLSGAGKQSLKPPGMTELEFALTKIKDSQQRKVDAYIAAALPENQSNFTYNQTVWDF